MSGALPDPNNLSFDTTFAQPYVTEAPEVEALLRLSEAGLRVDEVPVEMRERASGESKLRGKKSLLVVLTVIGTLFEFWRRRR